MLRRVFLWNRALKTNLSKSSTLWKVFKTNDCRKCYRLTIYKSYKNNLGVIFSHWEQNIYFPVIITNNSHINRHTPSINCDDRAENYRVLRETLNALMKCDETWEYINFLTFLNIEMAHVFEILHHGWQWLVCPALSMADHVLATQLSCFTTIFPHCSPNNGYQLITYNN